MDEATEDIPRSNPPLLSIHYIGGIVQDVTPEVVRSTCREINELIVTRLNRLTADIPIIVRTLEDLFIRLEVLQSSQKSEQLKTEPTVSALSALCVDVNHVMETISTRVTDAQQQVTVRQCIQDNRDVNNQQSIEQPATPPLENDSYGSIRNTRLIFNHQLVETNHRVHQPPPQWLIHLPRTLNTVSQIHSICQ